MKANTARKCGVAASQAIAPPRRRRVNPARPAIAVLSLFFLLGCVWPGCENTTRSTPSDEVVTLHGVLQRITVQGRQDNVFVGDDGRTLELVLDANSQELNSQTAAGKSLTITGTLGTFSGPIPIGVGREFIKVQSYQFDG